MTLQGCHHFITISMGFFFFFNLEMPTTGISFMFLLEHFARQWNRNTVTLFLTWAGFMFPPLVTTVSGLARTVPKNMISCRSRPGWCPTTKRLNEQDFAVQSDKKLPRKVQLHQKTIRPSSFFKRGIFYRSFEEIFHCILSFFFFLL